MKQAEANYKKAHALVYSLGNLITLLLLDALVNLMQYSVSSTDTPGKSFLPLRMKMNGASVRERIWSWWCKDPSASWPLRIHHLFSSVSPLVLPFISLATPVRFRDTAASETQQPQRHSGGKSSTLISNFECCRTPGNKGRGLSISSLLTTSLARPGARD